jgi:ABC-type transport system involved in multi-copper enzyme maturation permease subunit
MSRLVAGELRKLSTTRLWLWLLLAAMALTALYAGLNLAFTDDPDNFAPHLSTAEGQRLHYATAASAATALAAVLAAIGITGEFRHRTATTTFLTTPHRGRVVVAKLLTHTVIGAGYSVACLAVALAIGLPWLAGRDIEPSLAAGGIPATLGGVVAAGAVFGLLGVAVGALVREQVAAVVGLLIYQFIAEPIVTAVPALHDWSRYLPGQASSALAGSALENRDFLPAWQGGLLLLGYAAVIATAGVLLTRRRDVT